MAPIILPANQPEDRFYDGGPQISSFRNDPKSGPYRSEDWIGSTTCCAGEKQLGLTKLPSGKFLRDEIEAEPEKWLGKKHLEKYGVDTKILLKFLDAGQRLPVHAHPKDYWAKQHVGAKHGKAECWYILKPGTVYLGLKEDISPADLLQLVNDQDTEKLLGLLHAIDVKPHQTVYVPPGELHAIGQGLLVAELQEPEDLSILLDWKSFKIDGAKEGHLGLGFEKALTAVNKKRRTDEDMRSLITDENMYGRIVAKPSHEYFSLERVKIEETQRNAPGFAIVIVLEGDLELATENSETIKVPKGSTTVIPNGDGEITLQGTGEVLIARPPPSS